MKRVLTFSSAAVADDTFVVLSFTGSEAISTLFAYELELISKREDIDFDAMVEQPAWLGIQQGVQVDGGAEGVRTLKVHGVLSQFSQLDQGEGWTRYRATLVPALWRSTLNARSRIFLGSSVPEIVEQVLKDAGFSASDYESRLSGRTYAKREYVVQYDESDFQFASRLLEHEGICYFFLHQEGSAKLILGDTGDACERLTADATFKQTQEGDVGLAAAHWHQPETVQGLLCRQSAVPAEVVLQDYNYRVPGHALKSSRQVARTGAFGSVYTYGEHYKDADEGAVYARIRAEELACRRRVFSGRGDVRTFRAGATFSLREHYRDDFNAGYLITEIDHQGSQVVDHGSGVVQTSTYSNRFTCIRDDVPFRPERITPKPRIPGALNALVDAAGAGDYAELDDQGRYKVRLPLDLTDRSGGEASRYVRMAQPYAGEGMGMHFPLHKGTEVLLTHVNGDPDRPVISGAVSNPDTQNVVTARNQSQSVIRSAGRNELRLEDADGAEELFLHAQRDGVVVVRNDQRETIGHDHRIEIAHDRALKVGHDHTVTTTGAHQESIGGSAAVTIGADANRRIGGAETISVAKDRTLTVGGALAESIGADSTLSIGGDRAESVGGARTETTGGVWSAKARKVVIEAVDEIVLRAGDASITLRADGTVAIVGDDLRALGSGNIAIKAVKQVSIRGAKVVAN